MTRRILPAPLAYPYHLAAVEALPMNKNRLFRIGVKPSSSSSNTQQYFRHWRGGAISNRQRSKPPTIKAAEQISRGEIGQKHVCKRYIISRASLIRCRYNHDSNYATLLSMHEAVRRHRVSSRYHLSAESMPYIWRLAKAQVMCLD